MPSDFRRLHQECTEAFLEPRCICCLLLCNNMTADPEASSRTHL